MMQFTLEIPQETVNELQRASVEINARQSVIDRFLEKHLDDSNGNAIDSKPFQHFMSLLAEAEAEFEMAKDAVTQEYIPSFLQNHDVEWLLDYSNNTMTVTIKCDCDIPELEAYLKTINQ